MGIGSLVWRHRRASLKGIHGVAWLALWFYSLRHLLVGVASMDRAPIKGTFLLELISDCLRRSSFQPSFPVGVIRHMHLRLDLLVASVR